MGQSESEAGEDQDGSSQTEDEGESWPEGSETQPDAQSSEIFETTELSGTIEDRANLFASIELFEGLTPEEIREVVQVSREVELEADEVLFEQDDPSDALYVIEAGELQVCAAAKGGEDIVLAELGEGTVVGEMSIIGGGPRSATVQALSDTRLVALSREAFDSLRAQNRPAAYKIIMRLARTLGDRRRQGDARIQEVFDDPADKLEEFEEQVHEMLGQIKKA